MTQQAGRIISRILCADRGGGRGHDFMVGCYGVTSIQFVPGRRVGDISWFDIYEGDTLTARENAAFVHTVQFATGEKQEGKYNP